MTLRIFFCLASLFLSISSSNAFTTNTASISRPGAITSSAINLSASNNDEKDHSEIHSRRKAFEMVALATATLAFSPVLAAEALDMEAFANAQVSMQMEGKRNHA